MDKAVEDQGVAFGPGCQPSASAASADATASSQSGIPNALPGLSARETQALFGMRESDWEWGYFPFSRIAEESGLPRQHVRRTVRSLARKGFATFSSGLWTEDGRPAGSGYALTKRGREAVETFESIADLAFWAGVRAAQAIEARRAVPTEIGAVEDESAVAESDAPKVSTP